MKHATTFAVFAGFFPRGWRDFLKSVTAQHTKRHTTEFPLWWVVRGNGYQIWVSEIVLQDSTQSPPQWGICLESLATLNEAGLDKWQTLISGVKHLLDENNVEYKVT